MKTDLYKQATNLNQMAVFEWNILEDTLDFDEMMKILIQHDIPKTEAKKNLLLARWIHHEDRDGFRNQVQKMLSMETVPIIMFGSGLCIALNLRMEKLSKFPALSGTKKKLGRSRKN